MVRQVEKVVSGSICSGRGAAVTAGDLHKAHIGRCCTINKRRILLFTLLTKLLCIFSKSTRVTVFN